MKVYVDLVFLLNFCYDFLLLLTVNNVLKRKTSIKRLLLSSFIGALSILLLFLKLNNIIFFIIKILISILMVLISFKYISIKYTFNNLVYLYLVSIILAGFLYFLDINFSYNHYGLVFIFKGVSTNYILLIIISPIILLWYIKLTKKLKSTFNNYYHIEIYFDDYVIKGLSLYDNGNTLIDPITKKGILIVNDNLLKGIYNIRSPIYVPFNTISDSGLMTCFKPSYIILNNHKIYNYLIGVSKRKFNDGVICLLNNKLMEDNYV